MRKNNKLKKILNKYFRHEDFLNKKRPLCLFLFLEQFYKLFFYVASFLRRKISKNKQYLFKIISVGNLSVGGTGKSVFVQFLIENIPDKKGAIILRGYKGRNEKTGKSFLVFDGEKFFCNANYSGDEGFMLADSLQCPVIVGKDRAKSCDILRNKKLDIDFAILDDAYQNFAVKKDFEILLLDAKKPFENNHCLPAGRLREKDYSRADVIILTHANCVSSQAIENIKNKLLTNFDKTKIFVGMHKAIGLFLNNLHKIDFENIKKKKFLVFAGIGKFKHFIDDVNKMGLIVNSFIEFPDHHNYTKDNLRAILDVVKNKKLDGVITTQKDWIKIQNIVLSFEQKDQLNFYISRVAFEFLTYQDHINFFDLFRSNIR